MRTYAVLPFLSEGYPPLPGRLPTRYSPVRRSSTPEGAFPLDLHVLGAPPAFILSQDQTLQFELGVFRTRLTKGQIVRYSSCNVLGFPSFRLHRTLDLVFKEP